MSHQAALMMKPVKYTCPFTNKVYTLELFNQEKEDDFSYAMYQASLRRIQVLVRRDPEADEADLTEKAQHDFVMGHFGILSTDGCRWLVQAPGRMVVFSICTGCSAEEAKETCLSDPEGVGKAIDDVLSHSFPGLEKRWEAIKQKKNSPKASGGLSPDGQHPPTT